MLQIKKIYNFAKKYQDSMGLSWEVLYDYIINVGFKDVYKDEEKFFDLFSKYVYEFKMYRNTKLNKIKLFKLLRANKSTYIKYMTNSSEEYFIKAWKVTYDFLEHEKVSTSNVMITKILMGLGGRTPAYDAYFMDTFCSNPSFMANGINYLVMRLENEFGEKPLRTRKGNNPVPWERVLDMGLWYASYIEHDEYLI
jgi:hypothetical protein